MDNDERKIHLIGLTMMIVLVTLFAQGIIYIMIIDVFQSNDWRFWFGLIVTGFTIIFQGVMIFNAITELRNSKTVEVSEN